MWTSPSFLTWNKMRSFYVIPYFLLFSSPYVFINDEIRFLLWLFCKSLQKCNLLWTISANSNEVYCTTCRHYATRSYNMVCTTCHHSTEWRYGHINTRNKMTRNTMTSTYNRCMWDIYPKSVARYLKLNIKLQPSALLHCPRYSSSDSVKNRWQLDTIIYMRTH